MADSENQQPVNTTQQVTSQTPTTIPKKNPKRVAAGKATAEKTKQACEAQKKALAEAQILLLAIQNLQKKADPPVAAPVAAQCLTHSLKAKALETFSPQHNGLVS